jgi:hypothetical protein
MFYWKKFLQINAQNFVTLMRRNSLLNAKKGVTQCTDFRYINAQKIVVSMHKKSLHKRTEIRYINAHVFVSQCAKIRCID